MNCPSAMYLVMFFRPTLSTMRTSLHRQQNLVAFPSPTASSLSSGQILFHKLKIHTRHPSLPIDSHTLAILYFMASMPPQNTRLSFSPGTRRDGLMLAISSDSVHETEVINYNLKWRANTLNIFNACNVSQCVQFVIVL